MRIPVALLAAVVSVVLSTAGCGLVSDESNGPACSSETFNLHRHPAPLGDPDELAGAFDDAVREGLPFATMAEMVQRAGWSPAWDRAIYIGSATTDADLKQRSGTDLELACFTGLPQDSNNSDLVPPSVSLFLSAGKPVQAEWWFGQNPSLRFGKQEFVTPDTVVRLHPNKLFMVAE